MSSSTAFLDAAFDNQGNLFAAVYTGLDSHRLRIVPTNAANAALAHEFTFDSHSQISTMMWTTLPQSDKASAQKKRKKTGANSAIDSAALLESSEVVVLGTTQGSVLFYQPSTTNVISTLKTGSSAPITGLVSCSSKLFVLQRDSTYTEFDLRRLTLSVSSVLPVPEPTALSQPFENTNTAIVANATPHELKNNEEEIVYNGFATSIAQILSLPNNHFAALSTEDRQVFIYQQGQPKPVKALVCPATNAQSLCCNENGRLIAVTSEDGRVHIFDLESNAHSLNATNSGRSRNRSQAAVPHLVPAFSIAVNLAKRGSPLAVFRTRFEGPSLTLVWAEQGSVPVFEVVPVYSSDGTLLASDIVLEKLPATPVAQEHLVGGLDPASAPQFNDARTKVVSGADMDDLSDASDDDTLADRLESLEVELTKRGDPEPQSKSKKNRDEEEATKTSSSESNSRLRRKDLQLKLSQPGSFATLLNQSLTLNDKQLLEICLEERDPNMIKTSIVKLEPGLAAALLEHLAATASRSLNRSSTLAQWIRWTVVIHGAYLVTLPNLLRTLAGLHSTLSTRAATLPRLLALQGRLELLEEQLAVRSEYAAAQAAAEDDADEPEVYYDEEEATIVNGEEANDDDEYDEDNSDGIDHDENDDKEDFGSRNGADDMFDEDEIMLSE